MRLYNLALFVALCVTGDPAFAAAPPTVPPINSWKVADRWKVGDSWTVCVEQYSQEWMKGFGRSRRSKGPVHPEVVALYLMRVKVADTALIDDVRCLDLEFTAGKNAPVGVQEPCHVFVRDRDGWPIKALQGGTDATNRCLEHLNDAVIFTDSPDGRPIEIWPFIGPVSIKSTQSVFTLDFQQLNTGSNQLFVETVLKSADREQIRVKQIWDQNGKWWTEYERNIKGHKDLRARLVADDTPDPPSAMPAAITNQVAVNGPLVDDKKDPAGLHNDPQLKVRIGANLSKPTASDVVEQLQAETSIALHIDKSVTDRPVFEVVGWQGMPAWSVMLDLAASPAIAGYWERTGDGYRLMGTAKPEAEADELVNTTLASPVSSRSVFVAVNLGAILLLSVMVIRRRRTRKAS